MNKTEVKIVEMERRLSLLEKWTKYAFGRHFKQFSETGKVAEFEGDTKIVTEE